MSREQKIEKATPTGDAEVSLNAESVNALTALMNMRRFVESKVDWRDRKGWPPARDCVIAGIELLAKYVQDFGTAIGKAENGDIPESSALVQIAVQLYNQSFLSLGSFAQIGGGGNFNIGVAGEYLTHANSLALLGMFDLAKPWFINGCRALQNDHHSIGA